MFSIKQTASSPLSKDGKKVKKDEFLICLKMATENALECAWCENALECA